MCRLFLLIGMGWWLLLMLFFSFCFLCLIDSRLFVLGYIFLGRELKLL